jgi:hypothetical protein
MTTPTYTQTYANYDGTHSTVEVEYEPKDYIGALDHFHIAQCARQRMTLNCGNMLRWRGERRSFYTAIQMMEADKVGFMD